jgi:hypothetical protein
LPLGDGDRFGDEFPLPPLLVSPLGRAMGAGGAMGVMGGGRPMSPGPAPSPIDVEARRGGPIGLTWAGWCGCGGGSIGAC